MKIEFGNGYTLQDWGTAWGDGDQDRLIALAAGPIGGMGLTTREGDLLMTLSWLRSLSSRVVIPELHRSYFFLLGQFTGTLPLPGHPSAQGLITSIPLPSKSPMSLVTTDAPRLRAIAAIWQSAWLMGRPAARRAAAITA